MILLEKYIKAFLKEAASSAIIGLASDVTGKSQHQKAASYNVNMTELDSEETLLKVLENVGDNCFISFVDDYDEKVPRLEVSPEVSYDTPHGNYAYPLNIKNLKDIIEKSKVGGTSFALNRPYFHMFKKSNSLNYIEINKDGTNNYSGNLEKDLKTIVHTAVINFTAQLIEKEDKASSKNKLNIDHNNELLLIKKKIKRKLIVSKNAGRDSFKEEFLFLTKLLAKSVTYNNNRIPSDIIKETITYLVRLTKMEAFSQNNIFFKTRTGKVKSNFHILYFACYMLSNIISDNLSDLPSFEDKDPNDFDVSKINKKLTQKDDDLFGDLQLDKILNNALDNTTGPVFTMLLNSIDVDFINDKGSGTLHINEPIQAVYLNSSKKESINLIGTFNNIFKTKDINNIYELIPPIGESNKTVTMEKIINILEQNPQLSDLFGTELFDDVKLENSIEDLREKAWQDLTKKESKFFDFILFHSSNKIFNFNIYLERNGSKLIVFSIGIKEKFLNSSIEKQLKIIKREMPKIVKIEDSLSYIQVFLQKNKNKNIYRIEDLNSHNAVMGIIDKTMDYLANYEDSKDAKNELRMMIRLFIYFTQELSQLTNIATQSTLNHN